LGHPVCTMFVFVQCMHHVLLRRCYLPSWSFCFNKFDLRNKVYINAADRACDLAIPWNTGHTATTELRRRLGHDHIRRPALHGNRIWSSSKTVNNLSPLPTLNCRPSNRAFSRRRPATDWLAVRTADIVVTFQHKNHHFANMPGRSGGCRGRGGGGGCPLPLLAQIFS